MKDLLTGEEFEPKRITQKFENSDNRIKYHNDKAKIERQENARLDKPLRNNKKIIEELLKGNTAAEFHQQFLLGKGFDFKISNRVQTIENHQYFCVYQYIIIHNSEKQTTKFLLDDRY